MSQLEPPKIPVPLSTGLPDRSHTAPGTRRQFNTTALSHGFSVASSLGARFFGNPYFQAAVMIGSWIVNRKEEKKAKERAEAERREAAALKIDGVVSDANEPIPYPMGRVRTLGLVGYAWPADNLPYAPVPTVDNNVRGRIEGSLERSREAFVLIQTIHGLGKMGALYQAYANERDIDLPELSNDLRGKVLTQMQSGGTANSIATRFFTGHGDIQGAQGSERNENSKWNDVIVGTHVILQDVFDADADVLLFDGMPKFEGFSSLNRPRTLGFKAGSSTEVERKETVSDISPSPLQLLENWTNDLIGLDRSLDEVNLREVLVANNVSIHVMQGNGGLEAQAYPAYMNEVDGTSYATYGDAFRANGYERLSDRAERFGQSGAGMTGYEPGWAEDGPLIKARASQDAFRIFRHQCNGNLKPTENPADGFETILQTMPGSRWFRGLADGKWTLRHPVTGANELKPVSAVLDERHIQSMREIPQDGDSNDRLVVEFRNNNKTAVDSSITHPRPGSNAETAFKDTLGKSPKTDSFTLPLCDNQYHAAQVAWHNLVMGKARGWMLETKGTIEGYEQNDMLTISSWKPLKLSDEDVVVVAQVPRPDMTQLLIVAELVGDGAAYKHRVVPYEGTQPPLPEDGGKPPPPPMPCITCDLERRVVIYDLDCVLDDGGVPLPTQPFSLQSIGDLEVRRREAVRIVLPAARGAGADLATYSLTVESFDILPKPDGTWSAAALPKGLSFDAATRVLSGTVADDAVLTSSPHLRCTYTATSGTSTATSMFFVTTLDRELSIEFESPDANIRNNGHISGTTAKFGSTMRLSMVLKGANADEEDLSEWSWKYATSEQQVLSDPGGTIARTNDTTMQGDWRVPYGNSVDLQVAAADDAEEGEDPGNLRQTVHGTLTKGTQTLSKTLRIEAHD